MLNLASLLSVADSIWQPDCLNCARRIKLKEAGIWVSIRAVEA
jgi:hypothetical protein